MPKTLFLHIGHFKTGTTALQAFLGDNPKFLGKHQLAYGKANQHLSKHSIYAFSLYKAAGVTRLMHGYDKPDTPDALWTALFDEVRASRARSVIVSSEEFMRLGQYPQAAQHLRQIVQTHAQDLDIRVIAYLRPPARHLRSWYNQLVKMGVTVPDFNTAVTQVIEPIHYDYALALKPWAEIFGPGALIVRPYHEASRHDDSLYRDFLSIFGLELPDHGVKLPLIDPNPRMDDSVLELVRMMQNAGIPQDVLDWTVIRAQKFDEQQQGAGLDSPAADFDAVRAQTASGLEGLQHLIAADSTGLAQSLAAHLPEPEPQAERDIWRMTGVLLNELHALRQRMIKENAGIHDRIHRLEQQLGKGAKKKK